MDAFTLACTRERARKAARHANTKSVAPRPEKPRVNPPAGRREPAPTEEEPIGAWRDKMLAVKTKHPFVGKRVVWDDQHTITQQPQNRGGFSVSWRAFDATKQETVGHIIRFRPQGNGSLGVISVKSRGAVIQYTADELGRRVFIEEFEKE